MSVFAGKRSGERIGPISLVNTKRLSNIFAFRAGAWHPPAPPGSMNAPLGPQRGNSHQLGIYGPGPALHHGGPLGRDGVPTSMYRPPYRNTETVIIDIPYSDNGYHVRNRILGVRGVNILNLIASLGTTQSCLKIRMRGHGSGYREGPEQMELQEPMQLCVSADSEELLQRAVAAVKQLIDGARADFT